jgi:predicted Zn-dependent peptidase
MKKVISKRSVTAMTATKKVAGVYTFKTLPSGLRILTLPMKNPTVTVLVLVEAGSKYETKNQNGLSHFLEHMCFKGTTKRPSSNDIARELDTLGTQYNAFTGQEFTGYYAKGRSTQASVLIDIVSDLYLNPTLPSTEIEKEKGVICDEINMYEDIPARKVYDIFQELLYGNQPAGWSITGSKEQVRKFTRKDFIKYRDAHYTASATTIVVAGDIVESQVIATVTKAFKSASLTKKTTKVKTIEKQSKPQLALEYKKTDQSHILLGFRSLNMYHKDNAIITMLSGVLGSGMSSRLFAKVRDEMGCGYYVGAYNDTATDTGVFTLRAGVAPDRAVEVVEALLAECTKLKTELVGEVELQKIREIAAGSLFMGLESSDAVAEFYGSQVILRKDILLPKEIEEKLAKVTATEMRAMARKLFTPAKLNLALIGPHKNKKVFEKVIDRFE